MKQTYERQYVIIGAGGHAAVIADILYQCGCPLKGFLDDAIPFGTEVLDSKVIGKTDRCKDYLECLFIIGVGDNHIRKRIAQMYTLDYGKAIHPSAIIGKHVEIGCGSVFMGGCIINPRTVIGNHCIINTKTCIDHDNKLGDFVHVSPGAALGGTVFVGDETHIGIGASVRNNISICERVVIGAGAAIVRDITDSGTYVGVPARRIR